MLSRTIRLGCALSLAFVVCLATPTRAQEDPILEAVKMVVKDRTQPFTMLITLQIKEGETKKFEAAFAKAIAGTVKEKGNIAYQLNRDPAKPTSYVVYERWKNLPAIEAHIATKHIKALLAVLPDMLAGPPEVKILIPAGE